MLDVSGLLIEYFIKVCTGCASAYEAAGAGGECGAADENRTDATQLRNSQSKVAMARIPAG